MTTLFALGSMSSVYKQNRGLQVYIKLKLYIPYGEYLMRSYLIILQYFIRFAEFAVSDKVL